MNIYIVTGETAVGKSRFAVDFAKKIDGYIINGDSQQIIKELPILTDQPTKFNNIDHYLYGYKSCKEHISSYLWCCDVKKLLSEINKPAIIVGGSGFYLRNLIHGHCAIPEINKNTDMSKEEMVQFLKQHNSGLNLIDPYRLQRAVSIIIETGKTIEEWAIENNEQFINTKPKLILIKANDVNLNIQKRINNFFDDAVEEVRQNINTNELHRIIGFTEIKRYLNNEISRTDCIDLMICRTRQYAKRQRTWFRNKMQFDEVVYL